VRLHVTVVGRRGALCGTCDKERTVVIAEVMVIVMMKVLMVKIMVMMVVMMMVV
jgi:hypothetical protein